MWPYVLADLLMPLTVGLGLLLAGMVGVWLNRGPIRGRVILTLGVLVLVLLSYGIGSSAFTRYLERQHPVLLADQLETDGRSPRVMSTKYIVVLAGGLSMDPALPLSSWVSHASLVRLVEGVLLYHQFPKFSGVKLVISGGRRSGPVSEADVMGELALGLGVPEHDLLLESRSQDTAGQALALKPMLQHAPFILVTSAVHMPRAVRVFEAQGLHPIPAPTGFWEKDSPGSELSEWFPRAGQLLAAEHVVHEVLGLAWLTLTESGKLLGTPLHRDATP
ncbi:MAG: hypothetical protein D6690_02395 [Nitrospirae bacterium]|nr:MAG: hypothetical protein D6690_02395 [Nitrospirota bacterium]